MAKGFAPIVGTASRVLVLGTIPSVASLEAAQYYAHPRNAFWPIMQALFGIPRDAPYEERTAGLAASGVALWDVLAAAERPGSLDTDIVAGSVRTNALPDFFEAHPAIRTVFFNGQKAEQLFARFVLPDLARSGIDLTMTRLPSTSPANTATLDAKIAAWSALKDALREL